MTYSPALQRLIDGLNSLTDWEDRYRALIDLGRKVPSLEEAERCEANRVRGCVSQVWLVTEQSESEPVRFEIRADSDSAIVKGLLALLVAMYGGRTAAEIVGTDSRAAFAEMGLDRHLSPLRSNGLASIDQEIRRRAGRALADAE